MKSCADCIHLNVCRLKITVDKAEFLLYFGGDYQYFGAKLASICSQFKEEKVK